MRDYWRPKLWLFCLPIFAEVMPRDRFLQIYRYLHVSDNSQAVRRGNHNHDLLFKVRALLYLLQTRFRTLYNPGRELSIDESMIPFKGRIYFCQYIPSKRARFGIKAFVMAEAKSGHLYTDNYYQSYLSDITFSIKINDAISRRQQFNCGVPQGSVLGPLLFTIYCMPLTATT